MYHLLRLLLIAARVVDSPRGPRLCIKDYHLYWLFHMATDATRTLIDLYDWVRQVFCYPKNMSKIQYGIISFFPSSNTFQLGPFRSFNEESDCINESILRRRAGWFLQSNEGKHFHVDGLYYDTAIIPTFLFRVLSVDCPPDEWETILGIAIAEIAPGHEIRGFSHTVSLDVCLSQSKFFLHQRKLFLFTDIRSHSFTLTVFSGTSKPGRRT